MDLADPGIDAAVPQHTGEKFAERRHVLGRAVFAGIRQDQIEAQATAVIGRRTPAG